MYWPKLLAANWYGIMVLCAVLWVTVAGLLGTTHPNWSGMGILWAVLLGVFAWSFYSVKKTMAKELSELNTTLPDWITVVGDGIQQNGPSGATAFQPWNNFKGWREGERVMLLEMEGSAFMILPLSELSDVERQSIRQSILSHISTGKTSALASN
jgi:hypothetical protein